MLNNLDMQPNNAMNRWIAGILLFNFELVHVPGKDHVGPDGLSRRRSTPEDEEELQDEWVDEVLKLGVWVNTWVMGQALEKARSTLPHFQQSVGYLTRGQALTPPVAISKEVADEQVPLLLPLAFTMHSLPAQDTDIVIPQSDCDICADQEPPSIKDFLITAQKPTNIDDTIFRKFIKRVS